MFRSAADEERDIIARELTPGFVIQRGDVPGIPFVFCSPHSGQIYPERFLASSRLTADAIRKSEDSFVDDLFGNVTALGAPLISARFPRAYLDLNREPYELDPLLFTEPLPDHANTKSVRVMSGLGTVARVVADSEAIYRKPLKLAVAYERIARLYRPFHQALSALLDAKRHTFGHAILIDCHSMPSGPHPGGGLERPDIILGDRFGMSCRAELTLAVQRALQAEGFDVVLNRPYAGGYITEHYGKPSAGVDALQIEINRALYMNELRFERTRGFANVQASLDRALKRVTSLGLFDCRRADAAE